jgi:intracellular septation protein A
MSNLPVCHKAFEFLTHVTCANASAGVADFKTDHHTIDLAVNLVVSLCFEEVSLVDRMQMKTMVFFFAELTEYRRTDLARRLKRLLIKKLYDLVLSRRALHGSSLVAVRMISHPVALPEIYWRRVVPTSRGACRSPSARLLL